MTTLSPLLTFKLASAPANLATWSKPEDTILYEGCQTTTGITGQMSQSIFFAQQSIPLSENLKLTRTLTLTLGVFLGLGLGLVLGFVLVVYSTGQKYRWLIYLVVPIVT